VNLTEAAVPAIKPPEKKTSNGKTSQQQNYQYENAGQVHAI
jgi:hypothetical protein